MAKQLRGQSPCQVFARRSPRLPKSQQHLRGANATTDYVADTDQGAVKAYPYEKWSRLQGAKRCYEDVSRRATKRTDQRVAMFPAFANISKSRHFVTLRLLVLNYQHLTVIYVSLVRLALTGLNRSQARFQNISSNLTPLNLSKEA